jgi:N-carbamoyl-L-amino-acid hydrolase
MVFVRNPTGTSHSPAEHADRNDCLAAVDALAEVIKVFAAESSTRPTNMR